MASKNMQRRKGELLAIVVGCGCLVVIMISALSTVRWIGSMRARSRAVACLSIHNLDCMERLKADAKLSGNDLLDYYSPDYFSTADIDTTITTSEFAVDGLNGYIVTIESQEIGSPFSLTSKYDLVLIPNVDTGDSLEPEVNPE